MKIVVKVLSIVIAAGMGVLAAIAIGFFGLLIYDKNRGFIGITLTLLVGLLAIYIGYKIYKTARRRGILEFSTAVHASPDMDNLEPLGDSEVRRLNVKEYIELINNGKSFFAGGHIRIWGDRKGRSLEHIHVIKEAQYLEPESLLLIQFVDKSQVSVWNPKIITESSTYLKILKADKVKWEWRCENQFSDYYYTYIVENKRIRAETNFDWQTDNIDALLGEPALFISNY